MASGNSEPLIKYGEPVQVNNKKLKIIKIRQYLKNFFKTNYNFIK